MVRGGSCGGRRQSESEKCINSALVEAGYYSFMV